MASPFDGIDESNPCLVWPILETVLNRFAAGEMVVSARFGTDEKTWQKADAPFIERRIAKLKQECIERSGGGRSRFAKRMRFSRY